jgi:gluconolactonase
VTNICFGGADMKSAYVTLSGKGKVARMDWLRPGHKLAYY